MNVPLMLLIFLVATVLVGVVAVVLARSER
jgi:hypothetical protein